MTLDLKGREAARQWAIEATSSGGVPGNDYIDGILTAYLSTVTPADIDGLVERLRGGLPTLREVGGSEIAVDMAAVHAERAGAATVLEAQATELAAGRATMTALESALDDLLIEAGVQLDPDDALMDAILNARRVLFQHNGEFKDA